jgi:hypothetical protein
MLKSHDARKNTTSSLVDGADDSTRALQAAGKEQSKIDEVAARSSLQQEYEDVKILRDFKIKSLGIILKAGIDRKYKISFFKGV